MSYEPAPASGEQLKAAHCLACKYSLRGLPDDVDRCPECGRPFDRNDPRTYDDGTGAMWWLRWARPPGLIHSLLVVGLCARVLYEETYPFGWFLPCTEVVLVPLIAYYVIIAVISLGAWRGRLAPIRRRNRAWWLVTPACLLVVVVSATTHLPLRMRFSYSRPALEAEAQRLLRLPPPASLPAGRPGWGRCFPNQEFGSYFVGLVDVDYVRGHVYFTIGPGIRPAGLVFTADSSEPPEEDHWRVPYLPPQWALFAEP